MGISKYIVLILLLSIIQINVPQNVEIMISSDGVVIVKMNVSINEGLNQILLPTEPIPDTINVKMSGENIPSIYYNMTLIIPSEKPGNVIIEYLANTSIIGGKVVFKVSSIEATLKIAQGIVLLSLPENIIEVRTENNELILKFKGPSEISYTITKPIIVTPSETVPITSTTPFVSLLGQWPLLLIIIIAILAVIIFMRIRKINKKLELLDKAILNKLREKGGEMLQSELARELAIPKTTLWRRIRKLESLGYVEVERIGKVNLIRLKRS